MARKGYPAEFRRRALDLVAAGKPVAEVSADACRSTLDFVVGVDPHRDQHAVGVVEVVGGVVVFETSVAADSGGYAEALAAASAHAPGRRAFAVEGTGSYGAGLTRFLRGQGERVFEVGRLPKQRGRQKTDVLDAVRAARAVLS